MHQKKKLAIIIEVDSFIGDIIQHLSKTYEVLAIQPKTYKEIETAAEWADIVWFEFCNELFVHAINQNLRRRGKRVIARWHRFEIVESNFPARIDFGAIDDLILVSHDMLRVLKLRAPQITQKTRTHVIWNGLNLDRFKPIPSLDKKKIAWAAKPFIRKNQPLFLQIMHSLVKRDPSYTLHVAGEQEEFVMMPYLKRTTEKLGLTRNVFFHGWQRNMPAFLADKGVLLSTSVHESFGYNIAEAMAVGALPVVHDYPGAEEFWPDEIRFSSVDEAVEKIISGQTHQWTQYVQEKFPLAKQLRELDIVMGDRIPEMAKPLNLASLEQQAAGHLKRPVPLWLQQPAPAQQVQQPAAIPQVISVQQIRDAMPAVEVAMQPMQQPYLIQPKPAAMPAVERVAPVAALQPAQKAIEAVPAFSPINYQEERHRDGSHSADGSHDLLARYKGQFLNSFARKKQLSSMAELGCGDGNQLKYFSFDRYTGFDASKATIERTQATHRDKANYEFIWLGNQSLDWEMHEDAYDCAFSLDLLHRLTDDNGYISYLDQLFSLSQRYVVIYAADFEGPDIRGAADVRHRKFTADIASRFPQWTLLKLFENPHKFKESTEADFAIYTRDEFEDASDLNELKNVR